MNIHARLRSTSRTHRPVAHQVAGSAGILVLVALMVLLVAAEAQAYSSGQRIWVKTYGTAAHQVRSNALATGPGGVTCAVGRQGRSADSDWRGLVVKYSAAGRKLWARNFPDGPSTAFCDLTEVAFDGKGNVYVAGQLQPKGSTPDFAVVKYSPTGLLKWVKTYGGPAHLADYPSGLVVDPLGNIYVSGSSQVTSSSFAIAVIKYDAAGRLKWRKRTEPGAGSLTARDMALDGARNIYVAGTYAESGRGSSMVVKYSGASGSQLAFEKYQPPAADGNANGTSLAVRGSTVVVGGYGYASTASQDQDALVVAYTLALKQRYALLYDGVAHGSDAVFDVALDLKGNAYATGDAFVRSPYADAAQTFKVGPLGSVVWADAYLGASNDAEGESVVVDGSGNAYVAGYAENASGYYNLLVAKYAAGTTAKRAWLRTWGGEYGADDVWSIVLGPTGTLYVGCEGQTKTGLSQGVVAKYAQ